MIQVRENRIYAETKTLSAVIVNGFLTSLKSKATGEEFLNGVDPTVGSATQLIYRNHERIDLGGTRMSQVAVRRVSDAHAEVWFHSWEGDGILSIREDAETGDLVLEPSALSARPGVLACRWNLKGIREGIELVAPFFQGAKLALDDPLILNSRWRWPQDWEAGFAILQGEENGFWVRTEDDRYRYKSLRTGTESEPRVLSFDAEAHGPIDDNRAAGGLEWRINVFQGDWQVPAGQYRDWLWKTYRLKEAEAARQPWIGDVRFAVSWCPTNEAILDALAKRLDPRKVLLHLPHWRNDAYDENYPTYEPSEDAKRFIAKGRMMGFRVMPHFNAVDMDPSNPAYALVGDFRYRDIETNRAHGWAWDEGGWLPVPESGSSLTENRKRKVMVKIHPGLAMWRAILGESIQRAAESLDLETVFIDVTLTTGNLRNGLTENQTSTEGMKRLIAHVGSLGNGLVVGGEGLNEITMQGLSFAQAHLFRSHQRNGAGLERTGGCPLNDFLFGKLCRTLGYSGLGGRNEEEELRMRIHDEHGAIPTVTIHSPNEIETPNRAVKAFLDRAMD
jgi:hypothetical protein